MTVHWLWKADRCEDVFAHSTKVANFIFYDGHVKWKKWLDAFYPFTNNNWQLADPNPDPNNRQISVLPGCTETIPAVRPTSGSPNPKCQQFH